MGCASLAVLSLSLLQMLSAAQARSLWSTKPATHGAQASHDNILKSAYPVGNGKLGVLHFGPPGAEKMVLNVDSLWSGGPFENTSYTGGNPPSEKYSALPGIRSWISNNGTGNVSALLGSGRNFGSYHVLGNFSVNIDHGDNYTNYIRRLDLEDSFYSTSYEVRGAHFNTTLFCSNPAEVCVYRVTSNQDLPLVTVQFENQLVSGDLVNATCGMEYARFSGLTQRGSPEGMKFEARVRIEGNDNMECSGGGAVRILQSSGITGLTLVIGAGTNFDAKSGDAHHSYSFKGADPGPHVESVTAAGVKSTYDNLLSEHTSDYHALFKAFSLNLPDPRGSEKEETETIISRYAASGSGDPFLEALLFDYSCYMLISSSRENSLPANLQGRWNELTNPEWGADYHANINLQMSYWAADQTGLSRTSVAVWNYIQDTWVPRGSETAKLLYNASGWVTDNEMNIFGHTAMKDNAGSANYPVAAAWMMQHVWDNFDYGRNLTWLRDQGYPLLKGVVQFWLSQLQDDAFSKDDTLVANPCHSAEHGPTTFGCADFQQLIHQVFEAALNSIHYIGDDSNLEGELVVKLRKLDKGIHFTNWGAVNEWKIPDSYGYETNNTHRHLSHLVGWYPGYSVSSFQGGYKNSTIQNAVRISLDSRGTGTEDSDTGWGKVWRAACWARLNDTNRAYSELRLAIDSNFANNGLDIYKDPYEPFQIDANSGLAGAMLSMLVVDLPAAAGDERTRTVVLGPAIPSSWGGGNVKGLRLRGGRSVDFAWDSNGKVTQAILTGQGTSVKLVNVDGEPL